jgi:hypothetical protein
MDDWGEPPGARFTDPLTRHRYRRADLWYLHPSRASSRSQALCAFKMAGRRQGGFRGGVSMIFPRIR